MRNFQLITLLLGVVLVPVPAICSNDAYLESGTYQWVDESGTVNFTDNPMSVPGKYAKKANKRDSVRGEPVPATVRNDAPVRNRAMNSKSELSGGHDENWWRGRFSELRSHIQAIKDAAPEKEARLKGLHFKKVASNSVGMSPGVSGTPRKNKAAYLDLHAEIQADKERLAVLEKELDALEIGAARAGVPLEWRK
jgi:hypothetical protein